ERALIYATSSDRPKQVLAVRRANIEAIFKDLSHFRSKELLTEELPNFTEAAFAVALTEPKREPLELARGGSSEWRFVKPAYGAAAFQSDQPASPDDTKITGVRGLLSAIGRLRVETNEDFVADNVTDFAPYGLAADNPELLRIVVRGSRDGAPDG